MRNIANFFIYFLIFCLSPHSLIYICFVDLLSDALETGCTKCSETQKNGARKVSKYLYDNKKSMFDELKAKYDPDEKYINKYREEAHNEGIDV